MRIDYSEPKKSYISPQSGHSRPRKESSGTSPLALCITAVLSVTVGFGGGWMLSQRSAKKAFKAAMEQQSLENSPRQTPPQALPQKQPATPPQTPSDPRQAVQAGTPAAPAESGTPTAPEPQLSFYKALPSGQKSNVLGSGINKEEKPAKQPLQAAIPSNVTKPASPQNADEPHKPPVSAPPAAPPVKPAARQDASGFTVQVASYSLKSEADALKSKLAGKGYNVSITESNLGNKGVWYRVRVGKSLDQEAAKELAGKLGKGAMAIPEKD